MTKVISVFSQKGRVGKSTISVLLANLFFFQFDFKVAIVDADCPQQSIFKHRKTELEEIPASKLLQKKFNNTYAVQLPYPIIASNEGDCIKAIQQLRNTRKLDYIFVDAHKNFALAGMKGFLSEINYFLIPTFLDDFSIWAATGFYENLQKNIKPKSEHFKDCLLFFNKVARQNKLDETMRNLEEEFNILSQYVAQHALYEKSYRSTLLLLSIKSREGHRLMLFAQNFLAAINTD